MKHTILLSAALVCGGACALADEPVLTRPYIEPEAGDVRPVVTRTVNRGIKRRLPEIKNVDTVPALPAVTEQQIAELLPYQRPVGNFRVFNGFRHMEPVSFSRNIEWMVPTESESVVDRDLESEFGPDFEEYLEDESIFRPERPSFDVMNPDYTPLWLSRARRANRMAEDLEYTYILDHPLDKTYLAWELPEPPSLIPDDYSFSGFIKRLDIPEVARQEHLDIESGFKKTHWLHTTTDGIQFSQAYVSPNWYQGGNSYLALLFNFYWDVQLNPVYHPKVMFQSTLSYKLALNSVEDEFHKYSISQDLFQYNLKTGFKAYKNYWFYSFNLQFKTQFLNNYESNSEVRKAGFLSPSELTAGLGMTYNHNFLNDRLKFSASIAPATYNLKTCIDPKIDPVQYGIKLGRKFVNEGGSSAEMSFDWNLTSNINWKARVFLFTDYTYFLGDWENTFTFTINRFLSTQLYTHLRYDSSSELRPAAKWQHWMLKEILSFGLTYTFSTGK